MSSLNKVMLIGRLGQDPEVRYTQSNTAVATLNLATNERYKDGNGEYQDKTEWHRVVAWGRTAEICQQYLTKGSMIYVEGPLQTREWEDKQGQKRYTTEVKALQMTMLDSKGSGGGGMSEMPSAPSSNNAQNSGASASQGVNKTVNLDDIDDDLPF
ncbi:single-stranded DNA-binding protein [Bacteroidota bacterium]|jgi:single-strand DNA-binding protein|nr:single-stranded DNA-binding protein [Balneolaceae bacterium]MDC3136570.1 single-stranded DNA-binding protein [Bacteroidota bacterium]MDC3296489.1 single-stranded DNA-binding protein [Balneolaceae bacterium]